MKELIFLLLPVVVSMGCVWDNKEEYYPDSGGCDTSLVSFNEDIVPILANHCYSCHSNLNAPAFGGGLGLENHPDVATSAHRIQGAINHDNGFLPMPKDRNKLDPPSICLFEAWLEAGAPDN